MANPESLIHPEERGTGLNKLRRFRYMPCVFSVTVILVLTPLLVYFFVFAKPEEEDEEMMWSTDAPTNVSSTPSPQALMSWKDWEMKDIPDAVKGKMAAVNIEEHTLDLTTDGQNAEVFSRRVTPSTASSSPFSILLLHGAAFSSKNWADIETLELLGAMGHQTVAIDLPGYGKSTSAKNLGSSKEKGDFLAAYIQHEQLSRPVIVSPSMSGSFSIPYIMNTDASTCTQRTRGYIPVAPVATASYTHEQYSQCKVPAMIVYGTKDTGLGVSSLNNLRNLPNSGEFPLEDAGHPAYLDKPAEWHKLIYNFVLALEQLEEK